MDIYPSASHHRGGVQVGRGEIAVTGGIFGKKFKGKRRGIKQVMKDMISIHFICVHTQFIYSHKRKYIYKYVCVFQRKNAEKLNKTSRKKPNSLPVTVIHTQNSRTFRQKDLKFKASLDYQLRLGLYQYLIIYQQYPLISNVHAFQLTTFTVFLILNHSVKLHCLKQNKGELGRGTD